MTTPITTMSTQVIAPMHEFRSKAAVATIDDDSFIVIGGYRELEPRDEEKRLSSCEVYDGRSNKWTPLPRDMPYARWDCGAATIGRHIYVVGGQRSIHGGKYNEFLSGSMVAYSLDTKKWAIKKSMKQHRSECAVATYNGRLFVFGGYYIYHLKTLKNSEVYNPKTNIWRDLPPMPHERAGSAAVTVDDKIYVMGGYANGHGYLSSVDIFNVTTEQWEKGPDMPAPCIGLAATAVGKFIVVTGGYNLKINNKALTRTQIYDVREKKWSYGPSVNAGRSMHIAATINENRVVVAGGYDKSGYPLYTVEALAFNFSNTARHVQRSINQFHKNETISLSSRTRKLEMNETISLSSRTRKLEEEWGVSVKGSIRERIQNMEKEIYGSIRKGALATRLEKLETDTFS